MLFSRTMSRLGTALPAHLRIGICPSTAVHTLSTPLAPLTFHRPLTSGISSSGSSPSSSSSSSAGSASSMNSSSSTPTSSESGAGPTSPVSPAPTEAADEQRFRYNIAASFSPKGKKYDPERDIYKHTKLSPAYPSPTDPRSKAGQDAFFVAGIERWEGARALGVADGVGGYDSEGIDSAFFSQALCSRMAIAAKGALSEDVNPKALLNVGYKRVLDEDVIKGGASTACVAVLTQKGQMAVANLGDSGFVVLRAGKLVYASQAQTHSFNCPLQLAMIPRRMRELYGPMSDSPNDAHLSCHTMQHGDIVVFATDGVWDNVTNQDILRTVTSEMTASGAWAIEEGKGITATITSGPEIDGVVEKISKALVAKAKSLSTNNKIDGPFAREVQRLFPNETYRGGKVDDITVLVVGVRELALEAVPKL